MSAELSEREINQSFVSVDYWKEHFDPVCNIKPQYYTVDDQTKILTVLAENPEYPNSRPVIVLAGWFSMINGWTEVTKSVSKYTSVLYVESREKGSSILPNHKVDMSVERMADDFTQVSKQISFQLEDTVVVASSMGGTTMLEYLGRQELEPYSSVLIGPNPEFEVPKRLLKVVLRVPTFIVNPMKWAVKLYIRIFKIDMKKEPQQYEKYANVLDNAEPWKILHSARDTLWYEAWDHLADATIQSKVIFVGASADKMHGAEMTQKVHKVIENSLYVDFPSNKATHSKDMGNFVVKIVNDESIESYLTNTY